MVSFKEKTNRMTEVKQVKLAFRQVNNHKISCFLNGFVVRSKEDFFP